MMVDVVVLDGGFVVLMVAYSMRCGVGDWRLEGFSSSVVGVAYSRPYIQTNLLCVMSFGRLQRRRSVLNPMSYPHVRGRGMDGEEKITLFIVLHHRVYEY
jgi:hypothetical protein